MHDIVIRGGTIVDGLGTPRYMGDVAIDGDRITQVGGKAGPARRDVCAVVAIGRRQDHPVARRAGRRCRHHYERFGHHPPPAPR